MNSIFEKTYLYKKSPKIYWENTTIPPRPIKPGSKEARRQLHRNKF